MKFSVSIKCSFWIVIISTIFSCKKDNLIEPLIIERACGTITARADAQAGDTYMLNGIIYTVVDSAGLVEMIENGEDVSTAVTTFIRNMSGLFWGKSDFNQDLSAWDGRIRYPKV